MFSFSRLLKNGHLLRCAHHLSLRRTEKYASFLIMSRVVHLTIFEQPVRKFAVDNQEKKGIIFPVGAKKILCPEEHSIFEGLF
jgi:hypothetical protein